MRLWVHVLWNQFHSSYHGEGRVLATAGKRENETFERLLHQYGERVFAYAWWLYITSEPPAYNLAPVKHVDRFTSSKGNLIVTEKEDESAITRFPLSAFLAVHEGYVVKATMDISELGALPEEEKKDMKSGHRCFDTLNALRICHQARQKVVQGLKQKWAEADENW